MDLQCSIFPSPNLSGYYPPVELSDGEEELLLCDIDRAKLLERVKKIAETLETTKCQRIPWSTIADKYNQIYHAEPFINPTTLESALRKDKDELRKVLKKNSLLTRVLEIAKTLRIKKTSIPWTKITKIYNQKFPEAQFDNPSQLQGKLDSVSSIIRGALQPYLREEEINLSIDNRKRKKREATKAPSKHIQNLLNRVLEIIPTMPPLYPQSRIPWKEIAVLYSQKYEKISNIKLQSQLQTYVSRIRDCFKKIEPEITETQTKSTFTASSIKALDKGFQKGFLDDPPSDTVFLLGQSISLPPIPLDPALDSIGRIDSNLHQKKKRKISNRPTTYKRNKEITKLLNEALKIASVLPKPCSDRIPWKTIGEAYKENNPGADYDPDIFRNKLRRFTSQIRNCFIDEEKQTLQKVQENRVAKINSEFLQLPMNNILFEPSQNFL